MYGVGGFGKFGNTDANDIPMREAFEWNKADSGKDMALWYKNTGKWWDSTNLKPNDGISLEEEQNDPNSLYHFYKILLRLRKLNPALQTGNYETASNNNEHVFSFFRHTKNQRLLIVINLSEQNQEALIELAQFNNLSSLLVKNKTQPTKNAIILQPYEVQVWKVN